MPPQLTLSAKEARALLSGRKVARGRPRPSPLGVMNKTEESFAQLLAIQKADGEIVEWSFEPVRLRLGLDWKTSYTPDFLVYEADLSMTFIEVKGGKESDGGAWIAYWPEDSRLKVKTAARLFPLHRFRAAWPLRGGGGWDFEDF